MKYQIWQSANYLLDPDGDDWSQSQPSIQT